MGKLRIMSHNLWKCDHNLPAWEAMGRDCSAAIRAKGMVQVYEDTQPDIIGCQEMSFAMADEILCGLANRGQRYALLWGRDTPILYRQDRLELLDSDFLLYPDHVPGWEGIFNNYGTKSWCLAVFRDKTDGKCLIFMTTHLWWMSSDPASSHYQAGSDEARVHQLNMAMDRLEEYWKKHNCPVILVGDLNADYHKPVVQNALSRGYAHAHNAAVEYTDETQGYHDCGNNGFSDYLTGPFESAIDHILVKYVPEGFVRRFERYSPNHYLPLSDHSPVFADVEV